MNNLRVDFNDVKHFSSSKLKKLILDERDDISKNMIAKMYRKNHSLAESYKLYYRSSLWKECIRPLLIAYGINSRAYNRLINDRYQCNNCGKVLTSTKFLVPHHIKYPPLARKYKYKGFDNRVKLNHPDRIKFICINCHGEIHND